MHFTADDMDMVTRATQGGIHPHRCDECGTTTHGWSQPFPAQDGDVMWQCQRCGRYTTLRRRTILRREATAKDTGPGGAG